MGRPVDSRQKSLLFSFADITPGQEAPGRAASASWPGSSGVSAAGSASLSLEDGMSPEEGVAPDEGTASEDEDGPADASESLQVRLSYEEFALAYGGVWSERMEVFAYPACFATTPEVADCSVGVPVAFTNDVDEQTVTFATMDEEALEAALSAAEVPDSDAEQDPEAPEEPAPADPTQTPEPSATPSPTSSATGSPTPGESLTPAPDATQSSTQLSQDSSSGSSSGASAGSSGGAVTGWAAVFRSSSERSRATISDTVPGTMRVAAASSGGVVYSVGGSGGNYAATPLSPSMGWQVGAGSGDFTYGYDFVLPQANAGTTPGLGLSYSSGGVDAMSLAENGQADSAGIGWTMARSYVARKYGACADDGWSAKGDLCWNKRNGTVIDDFTIVLNGQSSTLVRIDQTNEFRLRQDPTWQVELRTGAGNGDNDGEHFVVTDTDGTKYFFGSNSDAAQTVPVYGDDAGEPCYGNSSTPAGQRWCMQAYQWNLQRAVDVHGNKIVYSYDEETNYYARWGNTTNTVAYDSAATLGKIEYGFTADGEIAHQIVNVVTGQRCTKELSGGTCDAGDNPVAKPHLWPDVPSDLICSAGQTCLVGSPTFFSTKRYSRIVTRTVEGNGGSPTTRTVDTYTLEHTMPDPDGSGPDQADLWLSQVTRTGSSGSGGDLASPPLRFFGTELRNRVVATGNERTLRKFRISGIRNEAGGKIDVVYGHSPNRTCDASYVNGRDRWNSNRECFAQKYAPPGGTAGWEWFHKYVVTRVALGDIALGYQLGTGSDTDLGTLRIYDYEYSGAPAWRFLDSRHMSTADETWNDWRGYAETRTRTRSSNNANSGVSGSPDVSVTRTVQFRGMNQSLPAPGQPLNNNVQINTSEITDNATEQFDEAWLAGKVAESETRTGDDKLISRTYHEYGNAVTAVDPYGINARVIYEKLTRVRTPISGAAHFITETTRVIDKGSNVQNNNFGVGVGTVTQSETISKTENGGAADYKTCTKTAWTTNNSTRVRRPSQVTTYAENCNNAASANMVGLVKNFYDNNQGTSTPGAVEKGLLTSTRTHLDEAGSRYEGTKTTYDAWGRPLTQTVGITENNTVGSTTTTDYNPQGGASVDDNLLTQISTEGPTGYTSLTKLDPRRGLPVEVIDLNNKTTSLSYDPLGRLTDVQLPNLASTNKQSIKYSYTDNMSAPGRVKTQIRFDDTATGEGRFEESYTFYDGWGRPIETQVPHPAADQPRKRIVAITGYDELGQVYASAPAESNEVPTSVSQSPFVAILNPELDDLYSWTQTTYDAAGRVTRTQDLTREEHVAVGVRSTDTTYTGDTITVTPPFGAGKAKTTLDAGGQPKYIVYRNAADTAWVDKATYSYTDLGQLAKVTKTLGGQESNWTWSYDWLGRTTQAVDPDTGTTTTTYPTTSGTEPTAVQVTNPDGVTKTTYDKLGRPTKRQTGASTSTLETVATWSYDTATPNGLGQVHRTTAIVPTGSPDAGSKFVTTVAGYTELGNPTKVTESYPATWTGQNATSNSASGLSGMVDVPVSFTYDLAGDPKTITYPEIEASGSLMPQTTVAYIKTPETGSPASITAQLGSSSQTAVLATYGYTNIGQIKTLTSADTGPAGTTTKPTFERRYSYDTALGRTDSITATIDPDGTGSAAADTRYTLGYTYDRHDNPTQILRTAKTTASGTTTTTSGRSCFTYDALNRLVTATDQVLTATAAPNCGESVSGMTTVYDYTYTYESTGDRLTTITSKATSTNQSVGYTYGSTGAPHRLTDITNPATTPDPFLPKAGTQTWNNAGRVTTAAPATGAATTYTYDKQGRLITTTRGTQATHNVYDTDGLRISRRTTTNNSNPTRVIYLSGGLELTATTSGLTSARRDHTTPEGIPLGSQANTAITWVLADTQGSTRLTTKSNNTTAVTSYAYTPYGDPVNTTATPPTPAAITSPGDRGYLNKPHDPLGDIRLDHRSYNPSTATFTSPDPILITTDPLNLNPYTYARHNPLAGSDPSGLLTTSGDLVGGGHIASGPMVDDRCSSANPCNVERPSFLDGLRDLTRDLGGGAVNGMAQLTELSATGLALQLADLSNPAISASNALNRQLGVDSDSGAYEVGQFLSPIPGAGAVTAVVKGAIAGGKTTLRLIKLIRKSRNAPEAAKSADELVDLASASRRSHILDGEVRPNGTFGGGHRPGTGFPGKSEFPAGWSDDRIMHEISDIATDPSLVWRAGNRPGDFFVNGTRGGVDIEVLIRNNQIWTGYPTNVPRNP